MTKHIKSRPAGGASATESRSDLTGAGPSQGNTLGAQRRHLGIMMKQPLLQSVSAVERLRIWLLRQAWFHSVLLPALPRQLRWILRKMYLAPIDLADRLMGRQDSGLPPKAHIFTGGVLDFAASGKGTLETICSITDLNPSSHIHFGRPAARYRLRHRPSCYRDAGFPQCKRWLRGLRHRS